MWRMFVRNAYDRRETLSDAELDRLLAALRDEVDRYRYAIRNYPPDRMERYGEPFLARLEERVSQVAGLIEDKARLR